MRTRTPEPIIPPCRMLTLGDRVANTSATVVTPPCFTASVAFTVVTALAISKLALLMRSRISRLTPTHASGPALRQPPSATSTAAINPSMSAFG